MKAKVSQISTGSFLKLAPFHTARPEEGPTDVKKDMGLFGLQVLDATNNPTCTALEQNLDHHFL